MRETKKTLSPVQEIALLVLPIGITALLTEAGYILRLQHLPGWVEVTSLLVLPLFLGLVLVYRLITKFTRRPITWTVVYGLFALFALPYVALLVAAANGDAL